MEDLVAREAAEGRLPGVEQAPAGVQERQQQAEEEMVSLRQLQLEDLLSKAEILDFQIARLQKMLTNSDTGFRREVLRGSSVNRRRRFDNQTTNALRTRSGMEAGGELGRMGSINTQLQALKNQRLELQIEIDKLKALDAAGVPDTLVPRNTKLPETGVDPNNRFSPLGVPGSRFNLESPEFQAKLHGMVVRWKNCKTQEERDTMEGFLMMEGVDVDSSDLKGERLVIVPENERGLLFLMGFLKAFIAILERLGKNKTPVDQLTGGAGTEEPKEMTPEERTAEIETNGKKLKEMNGTKDKLTKETKELQAKLDDKAKPLEGEAKTKVEEELKTKTEELKKITEEIEKLEKRQEALKEAEKSAPKLAESGEKPDDARVLADFEVIKETVKARMPEIVDQLIREAGIDFANNPGARLLLSKTGMSPEDFEKDFRYEFQKIMVMLIDSSSLEADGKGKYRINHDIDKMTTLIRTLPNAKNFEMSEADRTRLLRAVGKGATIEGKILHFPYMTEKEIRSEMLGILEEPKRAMRERIKMQTPRRVDVKKPVPRTETSGPNNDVLEGKDDVIDKFMEGKAKKLQEISEMINKAKSGDSKTFAKKFAAFPVDEKEMALVVGKVLPDLRDMAEATYNAATIESDGAGKYRTVIDFQQIANARQKFINILDEKFGPNEVSSVRIAVQSGMANLKTSLEREDGIAPSSWLTAKEWEVFGLHFR